MIAPTQTKVACRAAVAPWLSPRWSLNAASRLPAAAAPKPVASIITIDSRLLPALAWSRSRSRSVTVFMTVNCNELTAPNSASCSNRQPSGWPVSNSTKLAMARPTSTVLIISTRR